MSVKFFFGKFHGLNDPDKHRTFINWINSHKPLFGAILETHIKEFSSAHLMSTLCGGWHFQSNHLSDDDGRIILIWKDPLKLRVLSQTRQIVTCEISLPNCSPFIFTAVYASNLSDEIIDR